MIADSLAFQWFLNCGAKDQSEGRTNRRRCAASIRLGLERAKAAQERHIMQTVLKAVYASIIASVLFSGSALLIGCHTAEGVGKDTKSVGQAVEDTAKDARK